MRRILQFQSKSVLKSKSLIIPRRFFQAPTTTTQPSPLKEISPNFEDNPVYAALKKEHLDLTPIAVFQDLVSDFTRMKKSHNIYELLELLKSRKNPLNPAFFAVTIGSLRKLGQPLEALQVFEQMESEYNVKPSSRVYFDTLQLLSSMRNLERASLLWQEIPEKHSRQYEVMIEFLLQTVPERGVKLFSEFVDHVLKTNLLEQETILPTQNFKKQIPMQAFTNLFGSLGQHLSYCTQPTIQSFAISCCKYLSHPQADPSHQSRLVNYILNAHKALITKGESFTLDYFETMFLVLRYHPDGASLCREMYSEMLSNKLEPTRDTFDIFVETTFLRGEQDMAAQILENLDESIFKPTEKTKQLKDLIINNKNKLVKE